MKRRVMIAGAALIAGLLAPLAASAPADAGTGVGCSGSNCSVSLWHFVRLSGDVGSAGGSFVPISVPPPPCLWNDIGNATTGSEYIIQQWPNPSKSLPFGIYGSVKKAHSLLKDPQPGTWYWLPTNPAAGAAGAGACLRLPAYVFVLPGGAPPMPPVPAVDLAEYAYDHMGIPQPTLTTSPATKGYVNLATFVWTNSPRQEQVTATLGDQSVTVTAKPSSTTISAGSDGQAYSSGCGPGGAPYRVGHAPDTGPGVAPDCGVLWTAPASGTTVSATVTWNVTWGPGDHTLPAIQETGVSAALPIAEIQSVNGG